MTLGERIYKLRTAENLSQGDLAEALGVSRQSVSKWETDTSVPDLDKLVKLCALFGVSMDELVRGEEFKAETRSEPQIVLREGKAGVSARVAAGAVLLGLGILAVLIFLLFSNVWLGLLVGVPLIVCAVFCLTKPGRVALLTGWVGYAVFVAACRRSFGFWLFPFAGGVSGPVTFVLGILSLLALLGLVIWTIILLEKKGD